MARLRIKLKQRVKDHFKALENLDTEVLSEAYSR